MSRRIAAGIVLAAVGAALLGVWLLRGEEPTDEERIRALVDGAALAASEKRVADAVEGVSERFRGGGLDRLGVKRLVAFHVLRGEWVSVTVSGARVRVEGDRARANVDALLLRGVAAGKSLAALAPGEAAAHRFGLSLEREREGWRIVAAEWREVSLADALAGPPEPAAAAL